MNSLRFWIRCNVLLVASVLFVAFAASTSAQVQSTTTTTTSGVQTTEVKIESGEVVAVKGNNLFVKMADGTLRDYPNVPESAKVSVDGKQLGVHDLMPGMKLVRATVTTTTPQVVTTVQTVTGKVWQVNPPLVVILTLDDGTNQEFKIPEGQKFMVDGTETDAFGLKKGMVVSATKVVEVPETVVTKGKAVVGTMPWDAPVLIFAPK
jgi:hypothetical protein